MKKLQDQFFRLKKRLLRFKLHLPHALLHPKLFISAVLISLAIGIIYSFIIMKTESQRRLELASRQDAQLLKDLMGAKKQYEELKNTDQVKRNDSLQETVKNVQNAYGSAITVYENMLDLPSDNKELPKYRERFAMALKYLKDLNYASGSAELASLQTDISAAEAAAIASVAGIPNIGSLPANNAPPGSGFSRQRVDTNGSSYVVDVIAGDTGSTNVFVDTASDSDCANNCPVLSLGDYVARNGAYAGVNGSYFCPADYPSCAGKTNSFDTLAMNRKKHYFNSDNNVYSIVPAVIFGGSFVRFVGRSSDWGRDTSVNGVLANQPFMVSGGNVVFGGDGDPKKGSKGNRAFVANRGNTVYIGIVHNVTVAESALVMKAMGMENALNLDSGGSAALWADGGYKDGPGRNLPNAIVFVRK
ncbi:MAG: phosphodiester glycosidase family protein [Candidatus Levyibacteriota bacterium]